MSCSTVAVLTILFLALFLAGLLGITSYCDKQHYKAKIIQKGTRRYEVEFCYLCGTWEDYGWGWTTLHYRNSPEWEFSGNTGGGRYKPAVFETLEEAEYVKAEYEKYITMYGGID